MGAPSLITLTEAPGRGSATFEEGLWPRPLHDDDYSSSTHPEIIAFDKYVSNLQGDNKKYFGAFMSELAEAHDLIDKKCEIEEKMRMSWML